MGTNDALPEVPRISAIKDNSPSNDPRVEKPDDTPKTLPGHRVLNLSERREGDGIHVGAESDGSNDSHDSAVQNLNVSELVVYKDRMR
jgi:hypothetical protein